VVNVNGEYFGFGLAKTIPRNIIYIPSLAIGTPRLGSAVLYLYLGIHHIAKATTVVQWLVEYFAKSFFHER
jgi:hypothetical protein